MLQELLQVLFPSTCASCNDVLVRGERQICMNCLANLSLTHYSTMPHNPVEELLMAQFDLTKATAICHFQKESTVQHVVHAMKFHGNTELCRLMGRQMGLSLLSSGRFDDVDVLVPVPLHWRRRLKRGYNQSLLLCRGIAEVFHREVCNNAVVRHRYTHQQSLQNSHKRAYNVQGAFSVRKAKLLEGRHVLLVDDVITTGATISACAKVLSSIPGIKISVAAFSIA
ncbi:MAG: ComF family protein [Bacteroidales bacterium]|nr:ComF family protein [Bacteroidales bacterium]